MLDIQALILQTQQLLHSEQIGAASSISVVVQQCLMSPAEPEKGLCELHAALQYSNNPVFDADKLLNPGKLIHCTNDLLQVVSIGAPMPIMKKVQSFLLTPVKDHTILQYDLCVAVSGLDCLIPITEYNIYG